MKKFRFLTLWLLIIAMAFSPMAAFAEEAEDTAVDEEVTEEEASEDKELIDDETQAEELTQEEVSFGEVTVVDLGEEETAVQTAPVLTAEEKAALREENARERSSQYYKVASALESLGLYSFTDMDQEVIVTRGEFAKMIADLFNLDEATGTNVAQFNDISGHTYENEINLVAYYGIMNGVGKSAFAPDKEITYIQAVKTVVTALGYSPIAESWGGYKDGYVRVALELKLLKGANENLDDPITFLTAANLIALSSRSTVLEAVGVEGEHVIYNDAPQKTVLAVYHNIYEETGVMTDNGVSTTGSSITQGLETAVIGGRRLIGMKNAWRDYLGCNVRYFYTTQKGYDEVLYVTTEGITNNIVTLHADELLTDDSGFSARKVIAEVNGKKYTYKIHDYVDFMYNGVKDETFHNDSMKIKSGTLVLIDADADNVYELVKAWEYSDIVVETVLPNDERITARYGAEGYGALVYGDYDLAVFENVYGEEITASDIASGSVLSVFKSKDGTYIKMILSTDSESITVTSVDETDGGITITYGDTERALSYTYFTLCSDTSGIYPKPKSAVSYNVLMNYEGLIAMMTVTEGREEYAYAMTIEYGKGLKSGTAHMKLYFESDSCAVLPIADKLKIDGVKNKTAADLMADERIYADGALIPQLVKIIVNSKGELSAIWIDNEIDNEGVFGFNLDEFSLDYDGSGNRVSDLGVSGYGENRFIARSYRVTQNTKIFAIKGSDGTDVKKLQTTDPEEIRVLTWTEYIGSYAGSKYIRMYDADAMWACGAIVCCQPQGLSSRSFTVDKVSHIVDEDGVERLAVTGHYSGRYRVLREAEPGLLSSEVLRRYPDSDGKVHCGDVFEIMQDTDTDIRIAKLYYSPYRDTQDNCFVDIYHTSTTATMYQNNTIYVLGYPVALDRGIIGVYASENPDYVPLYNSATKTNGSAEQYFIHPYPSSVYILKYDQAANTLEKITINDLYSVGQVTAQGIEVVDKSTKVFFRRTSGIMYDLLVVTNIGN